MTMRMQMEHYPNYEAELEAIEQDGVTPKLLQRIIRKHTWNGLCNKRLIERYTASDVPIFHRAQRFEEEANAVNHKINNDFFGEIIDIKTGYFAGRPITYTYSRTQESEEETGGDAALVAASKALSDFVTRNNLYDLDMEATKLAAIAGYAGRLFYIDPQGHERAKIVPPYECIFLGRDGVAAPQYAIRYYTFQDMDDARTMRVEFYDARDIVFYEGDVNDLHETGRRAHLFDACPMQGIANNDEMIGDAEKVIELIDAYDRALSDASNEVESFANAYMLFENVNIDDEEIARGQRTGSFKFSGGGATGQIRFLEKNINDAFIEHFLQRLESNIYRFSKTPNLTDETFGEASGISLKFKLTGLETKCGMFQAKLSKAGTYMFQVLASSWQKKRIVVDPLQCVMEFKRNFPLDVLSEAQVVQALIGAGLPKRVAFAQLSSIDDIDYVMDLIEREKDGIPPLEEDVPGDDA